MKKSHFRSGKKLKKGQSMVEFAVVFPIFMAMVLFLIDILRFYFIQQTLSYQVREGLRAGVVYDPSDPPTTAGDDPDNPGTEIQIPMTRREVVERAVNQSNLFKFKISFTGGDSVPDPDVVVSLTPLDDPDNPDDVDLGGANTLITLEMDYQNFTFLTPFMGMLFESTPTGSIPLKVSQSFQNESL